MFCLDVQNDYSHPKAANIAKYKLGGQVIYDSRPARQYLERVKAGAHNVLPMSLWLPETGPQFTRPCCAIAVNRQSVTM